MCFLSSKMKKITEAAVIGFIVLLVGCSDDDAPKTPEESCDEFVAAFCRKNESCEGMDYATCASAFYQDINCSAAKRVVPDRCMSDINGQSCSMWSGAALPASCSSQ